MHVICNIVAVECFIAFMFYNLTRNGRYLRKYHKEQISMLIMYNFILASFLCNDTTYLCTYCLFKNIIGRYLLVTR